jgi:hypothetical protein
LRVVRSFIDNEADLEIAVRHRTGRMDKHHECQPIQ